MIVVEIPAALAADPQVVPVDPWRSGRVDDVLRRVPGVGWCMSAVFDDLTPSLVSQWVALAWRETCPTCDGRGWPLNDGPGLLPPRKPCPDCTNGERMVVGWTAEVEAVVPCMGESCRGGIGAHVCDSGRNDGAAYFDGKSHDWVDLPASDWSPGRYALVLRDRWPFGPTDDDYPWTPPSPCRLFSGFAELDEVLR